jgi:hypothetical protein
MKPSTSSVSLGKKLEIKVLKRICHRWILVSKTVKCRLSIGRKRSEEDGTGFLCQDSFMLLITFFKRSGSETVRHAPLERHTGRLGRGNSAKLN